MHILDHLKQRRTVRRFKSDEIAQDTLDAIYEAAMWAPSHGNAQPWEFVVVGPQSRAKLLVMFRAKADELLAEPDLPPPRRAAIEALKEDFGGAPFLVAVVSRRPADDLEKVENPLSVAAAVQNMCLAAWDHGVGEGETVVALLAMGHPADVPPAPPRDPYSDHLREVP